MLSRRDFLKFTGAAVGAVGLSGCSFMTGIAGKRSSSKTNIVLIMADDLGYNDLTCYRNFHDGQSSEYSPTCQTPNIDKLAKSGIRFTDFYSGAAVCSPSRAAMLTGRNPIRSGIYNYLSEDSPMHLRSGEITIAELLKSRNYKSGHFGKWHLTSKTANVLPNDQGYDYSFFTPVNASPSHRDPDNFYRNVEPVGKLPGYACQLVVDEATRWLDETCDNESPFYINVWFQEPHLPVASPEELSSRHRYNKEYYGCIENMDIAVGRLMEYLKKNNLIENTIVIFTSDNGSRWDYSNGPLRGEKCFNFEGGIRVPFIVSWPTRVPQGKESEFVGCFIDILPTVASITDTPLPSDRVIDGMDISCVFYGEKEDIERERPIFFYRYFHNPICMLRRGDWCLLGYEKLIPWSETLDEVKLANIKPWYFTEGHMEYLKKLEPRYFELYNLKTDKEQKEELSKSFPLKVEEMKKEMLALRNEMVKEGGDWYKEN